METNDIAKTLAASAVNSATNAAGYQVSKLVDVGVNGFLDMLFGQSKEDKLKEMNEHHDQMIEIVNKNKPAPPREHLSPRESVERDIHDTNVHINTAIIELERAREKSKCGVCKNTLDETINLVSEKTGEILDASEKVLAMQRLKESGELRPDATWQELNRKDKKLVESVVSTFKMANPELHARGDLENGRKKKRPVQKPKGKPQGKQTPRGRKSK